MTPIPTSKKLPHSNNKLVLTLGFLMCMVAYAFNLNTRQMKAVGLPWAPFQVLSQPGLQ